MRRSTKIIATIGPASNDWNTLQAMYEAGMDVVRINMSHASYAEAEKTIAWVRTLNRKVKYKIPIMIDTSGPEVRTGDLDVPIDLKKGTEVMLVDSNHVGLEASKPEIKIRFLGFEKMVKPGNSILLDNGLIVLEVLGKQDGALTCRVRDGGRIGSRRHVNFPGVHVDLPSISQKDKEDVKFGVEHGVDFVSQSFVRSADDIRSMRELLSSAHKWIKVIAKIENQEGVALAKDIIQESDVVMVARGDLGIETRIEALPGLQRNLVYATLTAGKRCIVATHLLESMVENPIPTRAEVGDVANAIYEGVDSVMLSAETSVGRYPIRAVERMALIAKESERIPGLRFSQNLHSKSEKQLMARSAVELAERLEAKGIVVITRNGFTADLVTNCAPQYVPIFAFSNSSHTRRQLNLNRGLYAYRIDFSSNPEKTIQTAMKILREHEGLNPSDRVIMISDVLSVGEVKSIQLRTAESYYAA